MPQSARTLRHFIRESLIREEDTDPDSPVTTTPAEEEAKQLALQTNKSKPEVQKTPLEQETDELSVANDLAQKMLSQGMPQTSVRDMLKAAGKKDLAERRLRINR